MVYMVDMVIAYFGSTQPYSAVSQRVMFVSMFRGRR